MTIKRLLLAIVLPLLFSAGTAFAQDRQVTGTVTDTSGAPVANASVLARGTSSGTKTTSDGAFTLQVPAGISTLVISSVNFETQEVSIGSGKVQVSLKPSAASLESVTVVAVGY